ncbi:hypothetical protein M422DRAFT_32551 [Sphaerobolus stellatus SS14]|uniref:Uncharacterized protein n=1 Tax=Sphaerobolus stellatus (strain SS14) TaxID=990650 RepID=A0A0C9VQ39_SPHS4|nr:hypothetical protein M422DRAFT_32551 [Sphaerobolus stellatus SS14]
MTAANQAKDNFDDSGSDSDNLEDLTQREWTKFFRQAFPTISSKLSQKTVRNMKEDCICYHKISEAISTVTEEWGRSVPYTYEKPFAGCSFNPRVQFGLAFRFTKTTFGNLMQCCVEPKIGYPKEVRKWMEEDPEGEDPLGISGISVSNFDKGLNQGESELWEIINKYGKRKEKGKGKESDKGKGKLGKEHEAKMLRKQLHI